MRIALRGAIAGAMGLVLSVTLAACDSSGGGGGGGGGDTPQLGFSLASSSDDFAQEMAGGGKFAAEQHGGVELQISAPPGVDPPAQVKLFQDLTRTATDGIAIENLAPELFVRPLADLAAQDVPLVAVDTLPAPGSNVGLYVGNSNRAAGRELAEAAIERLPDDVTTGTVVVGIPNPGVPVLEERAIGIKEAFAEALPDVKVLGPFETKSPPAENYAIWNGLIKAHPEAIAFLGVGDQDGYNLPKAKKANGGGDYLTAAFDLDPQTLEAVKNGTNFATMSPEHYFKGYVAIRLLAEHVADGKPLPEGWIDPGHLLVTSENVDEIIERQSSDEAKREWLKPRAEEFFADLESHIRPMSEAK